MRTDDIDPDEDDLDEEDETRTAAVDAMKAWFLERYEDPANRTPYESAEDGYIWIWGGPYDAREELTTQFDGEYPEEWIEEAAQDLEQESTEWAPVPSDEDYDSSLFTVIESNTKPLATLRQAIAVVEALLEENIDPHLGDALRRLLYANCITILETYLSDTFINVVLREHTLLQKLLDSSPDLSKQQVPLKDVIRQAEGIKETVKRHLLDVVWHNLAKVQAMYRETLGVEFGDTIADVARSIPRRHDIVHRNGRDKDGNDVAVSAGEVRALVNAVRAMAIAIDARLPGPDDLPC